MVPEFGGIPTGLPQVSLPQVRPDLIVALLPAAVTVAMLAATESLLSAVAADTISPASWEHRSIFFYQAFRDSPEKAIDPYECLSLSYAPGSRVVIRDEEWLVRRVDPSSDGGRLLSCDGVSELVRGRAALFLTELEDEIVVLDPAQTELVADTSSHFNSTFLYLEAQLRRSTCGPDSTPMPLDSVLFLTYLIPDTSGELASSFFCTNKLRHVLALESQSSSRQDIPGSSHHMLLDGSSTQHLNEFSHDLQPFLVIALKNDRFKFRVVRL